MLNFRHVLILISLVASAAQASGQAPTLQQPLPYLSIEDRGELVLENDEFSFQTWTTDSLPAKVNVIQYFGGTMADSKIFEPFTDRLQESLEADSFHVTTIINLDAAMWGTTGFVVSEVKSNKRKYPLSTIVLDEEGSGVRHWQLGEKGAGLAILDRAGKLFYFTRAALSDSEMHEALELVRSLVSSTTH
jgi:YtfJ family uncharacterized protein